MRNSQRVAAVACRILGDGKGARVGALLGEMRQQSRPIKPRDLGLIGSAHLRAKFESICVASESFCYKRAEVECDGVPYLAEAAFGYCPDGDDNRRIITGINWSVAIGSDPFRRLGAFDESLGYHSHKAAGRSPRADRRLFAPRVPAR